MRCFYLDANNEPGSEAILAELGILVNHTLFDIDQSHIPQYELRTLTCNRLDDVYKERKSNEKEVTYQSHLEGFFIDVRDSADCWLRISLSPRESLTIPAGRYHRLCSNSNHAITFLTHSYNGKSIDTKLRFPNSIDSGYHIPAPHRFRELTCELCRQFFECGWVTGTGGSISIRYGNRIYMTPSGVQKERILPDEIFLLDVKGDVLSFPPQKEPNKIPKLTDCSPLFFHAYRMRNAGAVIHSHGITCVLASALFPDSTEYRISHQEMIKGISGHGYLDELVVPIIENTPKESDLANSLQEAILRYPKTCAVLVRDHGIYVWGDSWEAAKRHSECLHYLFNVSIEMNKLGIKVPKKVKEISVSSDVNRKRKANCLTTVALGDLSDVKYVLLDIEGTTTPISFVKDVLFPYSSENVLGYLEENLESKQTQDIINSLLKQNAVDIMEKKISGAIDSNQDGKVDTKQLATYIKFLIASDRKVPSLKKLQGFIWKKGYASGDLKAVVYDDVPPFFRRMQDRGIPVCIYSSGSRGAQQLLFKHTNFGDLRGLLSSYFDTSVGQKIASNSYEDILLTLGAGDKPSEVLFVTDLVAEALAARNAGMRAVISIRPGNASLPENHDFPTITTFDQLLGY